MLNVCRVTCMLILLGLVLHLVRALLLKFSDNCLEFHCMHEKVHGEGYLDVRLSFVSPCDSFLTGTKG